MSLTLGEKLRQAREARGVSLSEVAEQTRISGLYLEAIENNDYRTLPGGIFNKGFVKSFARYVGIDEQEAIQDYASLAANEDNQIEDEPKTYRPQVLTDERTSSSMLPTIVFGVVILGLLAGGIITLVNYLQNNRNQQAVNTAADSNQNVNLSSNTSSGNSSASNQQISSLNESKIEFTALNAPVSVSSNTDGKRASFMITPDKSGVFEPKQNLRLAYSKDQAQNVRMKINGKQISLPSAPANPRRNAIEFEITNENIKRILENGSVSSENQ